MATTATGYRATFMHTPTGRVYSCTHDTEPGAVECLAKIMTVEGFTSADVRRANYSTFNGRRRTPSAYSQVSCGECGRWWRTKAAYVDDLPNTPQGDARCGNCNGAFPADELTDAGLCERCDHFSPQADEDCIKCLETAETHCRVCRRPLCRPCFTDHHHEGYGTPVTDSR